MWKLHLGDTDEDLKVYAKGEHRVPQLHRLLQRGNARVEAHNQGKGVDVGRQELALQVVEQNGVHNAQHSVHQGTAGMHPVEVSCHVPVNLSFVGGVVCLFVPPFSDSGFS